MIYSLYDIRHPLLSKYEFTFGTGQSAEIRAVAMTLNREYDAALEEWRKVVAVAKPNILDAAVMCLISKDKSLLEKLAALLLINGFTDTALELLDIIIEENPMSFKGNEMLGEVFLRGNKLKEAMLYFYKSLEIKDDYSVYEKIYNIYDKIEDKKSMNELGGIMKNKFPLSIWLKRI